LTARHAIGGAFWYVVVLAISFAPILGVVILWWSDLGYRPSTTFLFGGGELLLIGLVIAATGMVDAFRLALQHALPSYVRGIASAAFVVLLIDLLLASMWYGSLQTPSKAHPDQLVYDPAHVVHGSALLFALAALTALLVGALREGVKSG
jgi:hypothetical protein